MMKNKNSGATAFNDGGRAVQNEMGFNPVNRCEFCGRYYARGLFNYAKHMDNCPSIDKIKLTDPSDLFAKQEPPVLYVGAKGYELLDDYLK